MISESYYISDENISTKNYKPLNKYNEFFQKFYFKRIYKLNHMDFEYAIWQICYIFLSPQKVYRNFQYRKSLSNRWARDDPAFFVLMMLFCSCSTVIFALVLNMSFLHFIKFMIWVIIVDCGLVSIIMATGFWLLCNYCTAPPNIIEWGYAFDVQLNAYFPLIIILHLIQLPFLYSIILRNWFISAVVGNTFWLTGILYYLYITFLGYSALPHFQHSKLFLYPMSVVVFIYLSSIFLQWNLTASLCYFYQYRVI